MGFNNKARERIFSAVLLYRLKSVFQVKALQPPLPPKKSEISHKILIVKGSFFAAGTSVTDFGLEILKEYYSPLYSYPPLMT